MAQQHLYSRVPARMSAFNKTDGFDTFAYSENITRSFIETELASVYDNKPTKEDAVLINDGKLPPVYCQKMTDDGQFIQSCISFQQKDYTGERSAYLVHSLIMEGEECEQALSSPDNIIFNKSLFRTDLDDIDFNSFEMAPDTAMAELKYISAKTEDISFITKEYDPTMMRRTLYALIMAACGKTKSVYISLPANIAEFSEKSLRFINAVLQVFPYHVRPLLSFTTYVGDPARFTSFRIKCIPENLPAPPAAKGYSLRFTAREALGFTDEAVSTSIFLVNFFYSLFDNDAVRREFLNYASHVVKNSETMRKPSTKNLNELVFMFQQCCGLYQENVVLPNDDKVYEFVCIYDKNRTALSDEYRAQALKCLWRYPGNRLAIPKNVFSKVSSMYPGETAESKRTVMNIVLELIHTDIMRDKLFAFIKANYAGEDEHTKATINDDLCRVYYGGFLQAQILQFFSQNFPNEPEATRDTVVEKLLLTIRTPSIQAAVLEFFDTHYNILTDAQKEHFYTTFYAMMPECDELVLRLTEIVDKHIGDEDESFRQNVADKICELADANQKRKEPKLVPMLAKKDGFCADTVLKKVFGEWKGRKVFEDYVVAVWDRPADTRITSVAALADKAGDMQAETAARLFETVKNLFTAENTKFSLAVLMNSYNEIEAKEASDDIHRGFNKRLCDECIIPAICKAVPEAFNRKADADCISKLCAFAKDKKAITDCPEYKLVDNYFAVLDALNNGDAPALISGCCAFEQKTVRLWAADCLAKEIENGTCNAQALLMRVMIAYMKTGELGFEKSYGDFRNAMPETADAEKSAQAEAEAIEALITVGGHIYGSPLPEEKKTAAFGINSELMQIINAYVQKTGKKGRKSVLEFVGRQSVSPEYTAYIQKCADAGNTGGGFFARLFKK